MYTLRTGDVIGKTRAGQWALDAHIFPEEEALEKTLAIRNDPLGYKDRSAVKAWLRGLGNTVQRCADVVEAELCGLSRADCESMPTAASQPPDTRRKLIWNTRN